VNEFDEEFGVSKEASKPPAGARMIGRYRVVKQIGRGGMGEVLKAVDTATERTVAIKLIDAEAAREPDALRRFEREAKSAMALDHPRIAQIYAQEKDASGRPFLVMEYVDGKPLDRFLKENPEAPFSQLVDIVLQAAQGLDAAHRRSIIHRDIKPSNILITPAGGVKIIDFGLAKSLWDESSITATDMVVGTPRYISPEQGMGPGGGPSFRHLFARCHFLRTRHAPVTIRRRHALGDHDEAYQLAADAALHDQPTCACGHQPHHLQDDGEGSGRALSEL